jgi:hypothetical protein
MCVSPDIGWTPPSAIHLQALASCDRVEPTPLSLPHLLLRHAPSAIMMDPPFHARKLNHPELNLARRNFVSTPSAGPRRNRADLTGFLVFIALTPLSW